jgi:hypothetical protein
MRQLIPNSNPKEITKNPGLQREHRQAQHHFKVV